MSILKTISVSLSTLYLAFSMNTALADTSEVVNINTADANTIAKLVKGLGKKRAEAIVKHREEHGLFVSVKQLADVKGISKKFLDSRFDVLTQQIAFDE